MSCSSDWAVSSSSGRVVSSAYHRVVFTKEMKKEYTILMPQMLPIHFGMFQKMLQLEGYNVVQLNNEGQAVVDEGL